MAQIPNFRLGIARAVVALGLKDPLYLLNLSVPLKVDKYIYIAINAFFLNVTLVYVDEEQEHNLKTPTHPPFDSLVQYSKLQGQVFSHSFICDPILTPRF